MRTKPIRALSIAIPLFLADAAPRCGGSSRRDHEPPPETPDVTTPKDARASAAVISVAEVGRVVDPGR